MSTFPHVFPHRRLYSDGEPCAWCWVGSGILLASSARHEAWFQIYGIQPLSGRPCHVPVAAPPVTAWRCGTFATVWWCGIKKVKCKDGNEILGIKYVEGFQQPSCDYLELPLAGFTYPISRYPHFCTLGPGTSRPALLYVYAYGCGAEQATVSPKHFTTLFPGLCTSSYLP